MRLFRSTYADRKGRTRQAAKWYVEFTDHTGRVRRLAAFVDRRATEELGRKLMRLVECRASGDVLDSALRRWTEELPAHLRERLVKHGLIDARRAAASRPLQEHLEDYRASLEANNRGEKYINLTTSRAASVISGCGFCFWSDMAPGSVEKYLSDLRQNGLCIRTSNHYLRAIKQFCRWMVQNRRASESPVAHLKALNPHTDRRLERRALSPDECRKLLQATRNGPERYGMSGPERALLYRLAIGTGLRASEIRSLTRSSFDLDANPPTVTVEAGYSKHRREDTLALRPELADAIRAHVAYMLPATKVFTSPKSIKTMWPTAKMLAADLESAGIDVIDKVGRIVDFHALRHTLASHLAAAGVHPSTAQKLLRHSTIALTMNVYTHTAIEGQSAALAKLPDISSEPEAQVKAATGTDGSRVSADCSAEQGSLIDTERDCTGQRRGSRKGQAGQRVRAISEGNQMVRPAGLEPAACGLGNRRSILAELRARMHN